MKSNFNIYSVQNNCIKLATSYINQLALDFDGNLKRTIESIDQSKKLGCKYRLGPELEIPGYSCEDHFLEMDTYTHSDQSLAAILGSDITCDILCDIGCPILHNNVRYNCRVLCLNKKIVLIRPVVIADNDVNNYRKKRYFTPWDYSGLQDHALSDMLFSVTKQRTVKMGIGTISSQGTTLAFELCEELNIESIDQSKKLGCKYKLGPELEIPGYSCEDHFLEMDTFTHSDQSLAAILDSDITCDILCDIGCPILHNNVRYNCRVLCLNKKIVLIRPVVIADNDVNNYRKKRYFTPWDYSGLQDHALSDMLFSVTKQRTVKMGIGTISSQGTTLAFELCEELWSTDSPHIGLVLSGNAMIRVNGNMMIVQASQFRLNGAQMVCTFIDLDEIRTHRSDKTSFEDRSSRILQLPVVIDVRGFSLGQGYTSLVLSPKTHRVEEECVFGPSCWSWDYLRRSGGAQKPLPPSENVQTNLHAYGEPYLHSQAWLWSTVQSAIQSMSLRWLLLFSSLSTHYCSVNNSRASGYRQEHNSQHYGASRINNLFSFLLVISVVVLTKYYIEALRLNQCVKALCYQTVAMIAFMISSV
eukprot:gene13499-18112_t